MRLERFSEGGESSNNPPELKPQTLGQRLTQGAIEFAKDLRGTGLRILTYIVEFGAVDIAFRLAGANDQTAQYGAIGLTSASILAGEAYYWKRVSRKLPWFSSSFDFPPKFN